MIPLIIALVPLSSRVVYVASLGICNEEESDD